MAWYDFLTWLQETLTQALMGTDLRDVVTAYDDDDREDLPGDDPGTDTV